MTKTTTRTIRVDDELWEAAAQKAALEKRSVSDVLRGALQHYTKGSLLTFPIEWGDVPPGGPEFHIVNCTVEYDATGFGVIIRPWGVGQVVVADRRPVTIIGCNFGPNGFTRPGQGGRPSDGSRAARCPCD